MKTMADILKRAQEMKKFLASSKDSVSKEWECEICQDKGYIPDWEKGTAVICICEKKKRIQRLVKSAMIPDEFEQATFENYQTKTPMQKQMKAEAMKYVMEFERIRHTTENSFGFIAEVGEWMISQEPAGKRELLKEQYSNYGMGKTHLTIAMAKELLQRGIPVLVVNDETVMDELSIARMDDRDQYEKWIKAMMEIDVLVWDDLGKSSVSEFKQRIYYRIINHRYLKQLPIIFTSNECLAGLDHKLGPATFSRLMGMAKKYFLEVKGEDIRLR